MKDNKHNRTVWGEWYQSPSGIQENIFCTMNAVIFDTVFHQFEGVHYFHIFEIIL